MKYLINFFAITVSDQFTVDSLRLTFSIICYSKGQINKIVLCQQMSLIHKKRLFNSLKTKLYYKSKHFVACRSVILTYIVQ